jgi:hypothetical protein
MQKRPIARKATRDNPKREVGFPSSKGVPKSPNSETTGMSDRKKTVAEKVAALTREELETLPFRCVNCSGSFDDIKLYCSDLCSDEADWVRYVRRCRSDGRYERAEIQEAITIRLAHILSGGYDITTEKLEQYRMHFVNSL